MACVRLMTDFCVRRIATDCRPHQVLDQEHNGLSSVKRRIYEHLIH